MKGDLTKETFFMIKDIVSFYLKKDLANHGTFSLPSIRSFG